METPQRKSKKPIKLRNSFHKIRKIQFDYSLKYLVKFPFDLIFHANNMEKSTRKNSIVKMSSHKSCNKLRKDCVEYLEEKETEIRGSLKHGPPLSDDSLRRPILKSLVHCCRCVYLDCPLRGHFFFVFVCLQVPSSATAEDICIDLEDFGCSDASTLSITDDQRILYHRPDNCRPISIQLDN